MNKGCQCIDGLDWHFPTQVDLWSVANGNDCYTQLVEVENERSPEASIWDLLIAKPLNNFAKYVERNYLKLG